MDTHNDQFVDNDFCFACGTKNPLGLHLTFFTEGDLFMTRVTPKPHWQGFRGVMHGGLQSTVMDDMMSNHLFRVKGIWTVTAELTMRFRKPVPLDQDLLFTSEIESTQGRIWNMVSKCFIADSDLRTALSIGKARFMQIDPPKG